MKYVITGSTGHISKPLSEQLIKAGHDVTIISSNDDKVKQIEDLGATASIGSVEDVAFLTKTFAGTDAVYTMVPPK
ncbi:MAG: NAD-dependent dehydratase [Mucilaginibacter sp.]|nr:NAD-dependent dehydratase [Mucilaginibacter sp.]